MWRASLSVAVCVFVTANARYDPPIGADALDLEGFINATYAHLAEAVADDYRQVPICATHV